MNKVLTRMKNTKVLTALASGILLILVNVGLIDGAMSEKAMFIINTALGLGVTLGIFGNPESHVKEVEE